MNVPYFEPWINSQDKKFVLNALNQRWLTNGPYLKKFENNIKNFIGCKFCLGVGSATHALHLSIRALGIGEKDEVIVPTFTFSATANVVRYCGADPILVDVDPDTFNISPKEIERKITKNTKGIIVVHYGGQACDMDKILSLAKKNNLFVIEDCAHSLGSTFKGKKCGNLGQAGCFSFYPTKIITTGEGGIVTTNNSKINRTVKLLRSQGMTIQAKERELTARWKYDVIDLGYNYRLDEIRASLGFSQSQRIEQINKMRIKIAKKYDKMISEIKGIRIPATRNDRNHIYHLYTIKIENEYHLTRDQLFEKLHKNGIGTSVQYYPLHLMTLYKNHFSKKDFPVANYLKDVVLCLPIHSKMTEKHIEYIVKNLK